MELENEQPQTSLVSDTAGRRRHPWLTRIASAASLVLSLIVVLLLAIAIFRGEPVAPHHWVRIEDMSRQLPLAVVAGEDANFCNHRGVDWGEVNDVAPCA